MIRKDSRRSPQNFIFCTGSANPFLADPSDRRFRLMVLDPAGANKVDKDKQQQELQTAFIEFSAEFPRSALALITGLFVGLLEHSIEAGGGDKNREIKIDGGKRVITISAPNACGEPGLTDTGKD